MRYLLVLLAVFTVGCGEDVLHPTHVPQTIYPYTPTPPECMDYSAYRNAYKLLCEP